MSAKYVTTSFQKKVTPYLTTFNDAEKKQFYLDADEAVKELVSMGKDPKQVLWVMQSIGLYLYGNAGKNFYVDYQKIVLSDTCVLWSMQPPGGGASISSRLRKANCSSMQGMESIMMTG